MFRERMGIAMLYCMIFIFTAFSFGIAADKIPGASQKYQLYLENNPGNLTNFQAAVRTSSAFATTVYTFQDITIFSYFDNTDITIYNSGGATVATQTLNRDEYFTTTPGSGLYRIEGNKTYTVLVGDAISSTVNGFFAVDEAGRGVSTKLNTYMSANFSSYSDFIVFAYNDNTNYNVKNLSTGTLIAAGNLNAGQHYSFRNAGAVPFESALQVSASKPVSALSYTDQDYYVPSSNGTFTGTLFYGYSAYNGGWTNSVTVTSYYDNNTVVIRNTDTDVELANVTLQTGQVHVIQISDATFWTVTSSYPVSAANIPFYSWSGSYYYMARSIDQTGRGFGTLFYVPTIGSRIDVFSFDNGNNITVTKLGAWNAYPYSSPSVVWTGTLDEGGSYNFSSDYGSFVYKVESTGNTSVLQSNGGAGADFMPLEYALDYPDLAISTNDIEFSKPDDQIQAGDIITVTVTVYNYGNVAASNVSCIVYEGDPDQGAAPPVGSGNIPSIPAGESRSFNFSYTVPSNPQYRYLMAKVDPQDVIVESNESNNKAQRFIKPNEDLLPPVAVSVTAPSSLTLSGSVLTPNPFTIRLDLFNTGAIAATNVNITLALYDGLTLASGTLGVNMGDIPAGGTASWEYQVQANPAVSGFNRYNVTVTAGNAPTKVVSRAVNVPDGIPPAAPTGVAANLTGSGCANVSWNANSETDLSGYYLYYGTDGVNWNGTGLDLGSSPILVIGNPAVDVCGLPTGMTYFMVKAFDTSNNQSGASGVASVNNAGSFVEEPVFYGDSPFIWTVSPPQSGYVIGPNSYGDLGKLQRFDISGTKQLIKTNFYYGGKTINGSADNFDIVVRSVAGTGAPSTLLGSLTTNTDDIVTSASVEPTLYEFVSAIDVTNSFFIGMEWVSSIDDQFGLICDTIGEGDGAKRAWEKWSDGTYHDIQSAWGGFDVDLWIEAILLVPSTGVNNEVNQPRQYRLSQNFPNPFNPTTVIEFAIPETEHVTLKIFDLLGNEIRTLVDESMPVGTYQATFNGTGLRSGMYLYRLETRNFSETRKLMILK